LTVMTQGGRGSICCASLIYMFEIVHTIPSANKSPMTDETRINLASKDPCPLRHHIYEKREGKRKGRRDRKDIKPEKKSSKNKTVDEIRLACCPIPVKV